MHTPSFGGDLESHNHNPEVNSTQGPQDVALQEMAEPNTIVPTSDYLQTHHIEDLPPPKLDFTAPPPYEVASKLPTYEEVQREKSRLGEPQISNLSPNSNPQSLAFLAIDTEGHENENESGLLGTDFMFFTAFLVAFLFNWIGFLLLMCFCHTIAARYGALSGFGLSLAKWTFIVKHSTDLASRENSWLWWLIMAFGLLIFVRAIIQYLNIKRGWRVNQMVKLSSNCPEVDGKFLYSEKPQSQLIDSRGIINDFPGFLWSVLKFLRSSKEGFSIVKLQVNASDGNRKTLNYLFTKQRQSFAAKIEVVLCAVKKLEQILS
ncbi:hypothetical protein RUM43_006665 [Polyplax serrata]|uniref:Uncharacterized protein n=1 Tax=Polyplax serrata TaxID=468196 RepID=A0AAN8PF94_POLSC